MSAKRIFTMGLVVLAFCAVAQAQLGYQLDVTTFYQFGDPPGALGGFSASPDSSFFTVTNNGATTFTGSIGDLAVSQFAGNFSYTISGLTLAPGQSATFSTSPESSNVGGFNGPFGSVQPGIQIQINGLINGSEAISLSVNDADIHSGVPRVSPFSGITTDAYVLQGGDPLGGDNGDGFEVTQAPGHFSFFEASAAAVPEPGTIAMLGTVIAAIGLRKKLFKKSA